MSKVIGSIRSPVTFSATDLPRLLHYTHTPHTHTRTHICIYNLRFSFLPVTVHSIHSRSRERWRIRWLASRKKGRARGRIVALPLREAGKKRARKAVQVGEVSVARVTRRNTFACKTIGNFGLSALFGQGQSWAVINSLVIDYSM